MIIQIGTEVDESRILWKRKESDEWKRADIDDLIEAYENKQKEPKPGDSISRQALIDEILEDGNGAVLSYTKGMDEDELVERIEKQMIQHFIGVIEYAPPVEPEQSKGEWVYLKDDETHQPEEGLFVVCKCSNCGEQECFLIDSKTKEIHGDNYCCTCGADMRKNIRRR